MKSEGRLLDGESGGERFALSGGYDDAVMSQIAVLHGHRSRFRAWVALRTSYEGNTAKIAPADKVGPKVRQAYNHSDKFERWRGMIEAWANFLLNCADGNAIGIGDNE